MNLKKNDWLLLVAVAAYSYLFYEQSAGINYLIFTGMLLTLTVVQTSRKTMEQISWRLTAAACLVSAISVVLVNSGLSVLANILSLILLAGFSRMPYTSVFVTGLNSLYSLATSLFNFTFLRERFFPESAGSRPLVIAGMSGQQVKTVGIPVAVTLVFLVIYCSASAAFTRLIGRIDLSFISFSWLFFTFSGFWLLFGFFRQQLIQKITVADVATGNNLLRLRKTVIKTAKKLGLKYEYKTGFILLVLLNFLLLAFNLSDAWYLTFGELPADIPFSEYLHEGVNMLIFSILLAIAVLLYLFRGNLNFFSRNRPLKLLAYAWLVQNLVLVLLTLTKNSLYVMEFGLTYKRIGVYTYLTLTGIGLFTSFIKVAEVKNNWFLFRKNSWAVYLVLLLLSCFNWDRILTNYNLAYARKPDLSYLVTLSDSNIGLLQQNPEINQSPQLHRAINRRAVAAKKRIASNQWLSWNYNDQRLAAELKKPDYLPVNTNR